MWSWVLFTDFPRLRNHPRLSLSARRAQPRVGVLAPAEAKPNEVTRVAVAPALVAPGRHRYVARHDHKDRGVLFIALVADQQTGAIRGQAGLDPHVSTSTQLAAHQYSSGSRIVVTDLSASVMTQ